MTLYREVDPKSNSDIALEWDLLAPIRREQISAGSDRTFHDVMVPHIFSLIQGRRYRRILDVGCGTGELTVMLSRFGERTDGIDISRNSIEISKSQLVTRSSGVEFHISSIEEYSYSKRRKYDLIVANMVLMDVMNFQKVIRSISEMMSRDTVFVFSMTHPAFWPSYYGYASEPWYSYDREIFIEGPFVITSDRHNRKKDGLPKISTHVHRPLHTYLNTFSDLGLKLGRMVEPVPTNDTRSIYGVTGVFPRYILGTCVKIE